MPSILSIKEVERIIERVAGKFHVDGLEFEDLVQIGRIAVWQIIERYKIDKQNINQYKGLIWKSVEFALGNELKRSKAQKRLELSKVTSLDKNFNNEDDAGTLHDIMPSDAENALDIMINRENAEKLLKKLGSKSLKERTPKSKRAVVWLLTHILDLNKKDIPKEINYSTFVKFGLQRWLWIFFNNSPFRAINLAYPGEFLPYQMARAPQGCWKGIRGRERAIETLRIILEKTGYSPEIFPKLVRYEFFEEFKIAVPLGKIFGWNRFDYLEAVFPGRYHSWELSYTPRGYFDSLENITKAVRWLVEEQLGYKMDVLSIDDIWRERIALKITKETFSEYGLREIIANYHSPEPILRLVYPDKFLPWSFQGKNKWSGEEGKKLAADATRWVIERHAKISPFSSTINCNFFRNNGLWGMLTAKSAGFNTSPKLALKNAYPELFQ